MLKYFLITKYEDLETNQYQVLKDNYFTNPKDSWYEEKEVNGSKEKIWDKNKVTEFWQLIRRHAMKFGRLEKYYNFSDFIFPEFEDVSDRVTKEDKLNYSENFWNAGEVRNFSEDVEFQLAQFLGQADFSESSFMKYAGFGNVKFSELVNFNKVIFSKDVIFAYSEFLGKSDFVHSIFMGQVNFEKAKFRSDSFIHHTTFSKETYFNKTQFLGSTTFDASSFLGVSSFIDTWFKKGVSFGGAEFSKENETLFKGLKGDQQGILQLDFSMVNFPKSVVFREVNLKNTFFNESDITEVKFKNCIWNEEKGRIIFDNESDVTKVKFENGFWDKQKRMFVRKNKLPFNNESPYKEQENLYRELKINFENSKDWELAGKAYVSEMEMRKKTFYDEFVKSIKNFRVLKAVIAFINYFLFNFYKYLGGYTQN
ncbi:pentapeptide repeat-containing protein [Tenacibaculum sp. AHE15PA]|uniref:pentapeptide repeat-containing protein n=1 Tax=unclassified Tenacibaculum TaxID=2635139 RepID=UPI001C4F2738|nr:MULTISPECIES: pentapeptide repeat-containing protein [unclassified Tenacibaculum]QXP72366.1 pentapeptide repeat-containing protein [Tenacibaculum sp. AHE14PA]QXP76281.1 pentapeptide repeat-containing protein [Tenacibaculum sp. AHE15PA]